MRNKKSKQTTNKAAEGFDYAAFEEQAIAGLQGGAGLIGSEGVLTSLIQRLANASNGVVKPTICYAAASNPVKHPNPFTKSAFSKTLLSSTHPTVCTIYIHLTSNLKPMKGCDLYRFLTFI